MKAAEVIALLDNLPGEATKVTTGARSVYFDWRGASWRVGFDLAVHRLVDGDYRRTNLAFRIERVLRAAVE